MDGFEIFIPNFDGLIKAGRYDFERGLELVDLDRNDLFTMGVAGHLEKAVNR